MQEKVFLRSTEQEREITPAQDRAFLYELQRGLLLALREAGQLSDVQYRHAEARLSEQRRSCAASGLPAQVPEGEP